MKITVDVTVVKELQGFRATYLPPSGSKGEIESGKFPAKANRDRAGRLVKKCQPPSRSPSGAATVRAALSS